MRYTFKGGIRLLSAVLALGFLAFSYAPNARANGWHQQIFVTVKKPVQIPGRVIGPGTYSFRLVNPSWGLPTVAITDETTNKFVAFLPTMPAYRSTRAGRPIVKLEERKAGAPLAIHEWFYPGLYRGMKFTYPRIHREEEMGALTHKAQTAKG